MRIVGSFNSGFFTAVFCFGISSDITGHNRFVLLVLFALLVLLILFTKVESLDFFDKGGEGQAAFDSRRNAAAQERSGDTRLFSLGAVSSSDKIVACLFDLDYHSSHVSRGKVLVDQGLDIEAVEDTRHTTCLLAFLNDSGRVLCCRLCCRKFCSQRNDFCVFCLDISLELFKFFVAAHRAKVIYRGVLFAKLSVHFFDFVLSFCAESGNVEVRSFFVTFDMALVPMSHVANPAFNIVLLFDLLLLE